MATQRLAASIPACGLVAALALNAFAEPWDSFEDGVPDAWTAEHGGLAVSSAHARHGRHSLRWDWRPGERIVVRRGVGNLARTGGYAGTYAKPTFGLWYFVDEPRQEGLRIEFCTGSRVSAHLEVSLDQSGWRRLHAWLPRDAVGRIDPRTDTIRLIAPATGDPGTLYIDLVVYNGLLDYRRQYIPAAAHFDPVLTDPCLAAAAQRSSPEAMAAAQDVADRVDRYLVGRIQGRDWNHVRDEIDHAVCPDANGGLLRQHVVHDRDLLFYEGIEGLAPCSMLTGLLREAAVHWSITTSPETRAEAAERFTRLARHLRAQGMRAASGFEWAWYEGRDLVEACVIARELLSRESLLDWAIDFVNSNYGLRSVLRDEPETVDMDYFHLTAPARLYGSLLLPAPDTRAAWLDAFSQRLADGVLRPGANGFKPDGSVYHHEGHNLPYALYGVNTLARLIAFLSGTPFGLRSDAHERVRDSLRAMRFYCNLTDAPLSLQGRHPFNPRASQLMTGSFWLMARAGRSGDGRELDAEMAGAYLSYHPDEQRRDVFLQAGIEAAAPPQGHRAFPYGCFSAHRRGRWLAVVRGQSHYVWGAEIYEGANRFGLFLGHGFLEILGGGTPVTLRDSGCVEAGWDWRRLDGTTALDLPIEALRPPAPGTEFVYSTSTWAGGLSHREWNGVFALRLEPVPARAGGLVAQKTYFFFDDRIVCTGSSIAATNRDHSVLTTLFQKHLASPGAPVEVNGRPITGFPERIRLAADKPHTLLDPRNTGYYVAQGGALRLERTEQVSRDPTDRHWTHGPFASAWIDHGPAPQAASYAYVALVNTTAKRLASFAEAMPSSAPPIVIARHDASVHAVWDRESRTWGVAIYEAVDDLDMAAMPAHEGAPGACPLAGADAPCIVMIEDLEEAGLLISVADPDLRLQEHVSQPHRVTVTLRGLWQIADTARPEVSCQPDAGQHTTRLLAWCREGRTLTVNLTPVALSGPDAVGR